MLIVTRELRVDWSRIIDNLTGPCRMTQQQIADEIGVSRSALGDYRDDRCIEPAFWVGSRLVLLWAERTGCKWTDAPTRKVLPSVSQVLRS